MLRDLQATRARRLAQQFRDEAQRIRQSLAEFWEPELAALPLAARDRRARVQGMVDLLRGQAAAAERQANLYERQARAPETAPDIAASPPPAEAQTSPAREGGAQPANESLRAQPDTVATARSEPQFVGRSRGVRRSGSAGCWRTRAERLRQQRPATVAPPVRADEARDRAPAPPTNGVVAEPVVLALPAPSAAPGATAEALLAEALSPVPARAAAAPDPAAGEPAILEREPGGAEQAADPPRLVVVRSLPPTSPADNPREWPAELTPYAPVGQRFGLESGHDPLTELPDQAVFLQALERALARAVAHRRAIAVLYFDLDDFAGVNQRFGYAAGSALLADIASRLRASVRAGDMVARVGGDKFAVLMEDLAAASVALELANRLADQLRPVGIGGQGLTLSASTGIVVSNGGQVAATDVLRSAQVASYAAKRKGPGRRELVDRRVEALIRWNHPRLGRRAPGEFLPLAEKTGLIEPLGRWVFEAACAQMQRWQSQHPSSSPMSLSLNLSASQSQQHKFVDALAQVLRDTRLDPTTIKLEIAEGLIMTGPESTVATLRAYKDLGVQLAIDDFGTAYLAAHYLRRFPLDALKLDRPYTEGFGHDAEDTKVVQAVLDFAERRHLLVSAEGIETRNQLVQMRDLGLERGQGYYIARSAPRC